MGWAGTGSSVQEPSGWRTPDVGSVAASGGAPGPVGTGAGASRERAATIDGEAWIRDRVELKIF